MRCLDRTLLPLSIAWLVVAGCSDDGLAPPQEEGSSGVATGTVPGSEGSSGESDPDTAGLTTAPSDSSGGSSSSGTDDGESDGSTTGAEPPPMTCEGDEQCILVDNCCECAAHHVDDVIAECLMECIQPMCAALGIPDVGVVCEGGACELEPYDCSGVVACDSLPPACPEGSLPEVGNGGGGGCWTGACIPVEACDPVPGCEFCQDTEACVATQAQQGTFYSCRAIPEECAGVPTCECMPPDTCEMPFDTCIDMDGQITCSCPMC
jgi:hypothetical protein